MSYSLILWYIIVTLTPEYKGTHTNYRVNHFIFVLKLRMSTNYVSVKAVD